MEPLTPDLAGSSSDGSELFTEDFLGHLEDAQARSALVRALVQARHRLALTQRTLAVRMGTTQSAVSDLEQGGQDPRLSTLQRYARGVECALHLSLHVHNLAGTPALWPEVGEPRPLTEAEAILAFPLDRLDIAAMSAPPPLDEFSQVPEAAW